MALMVACGVLALAGLFAITVWGDLGIVAPASQATGGRVGAAVRRYLWWADLVITAGLTAGVLIAGAGGRLVMRLLAVSSPDARGALTEADETVGRITFGGTLGFVVFGALPLAMVTAIGFAIIYRWLPRGRLTAVGAVVVAVAARIAPSIANWWTSSRTTMVGRVLLAGGSLLALPGFV